MVLLMDPEFAHPNDNILRNVGMFLCQYRCQSPIVASRDPLKITSLCDANERSCTRTPQSGAICSHGHDRGAGSVSMGKLTFAVGLTVAFDLGEAIARFAAHSVAPISDAGHNLVDAAALGFSLLRHVAWETAVEFQNDFWMSQGHDSRGRGECGLAGRHIHFRRGS